MPVPVHISKDRKSTELVRMIATRDTLGIGLYTPEEAAFYARVSPRLLKRWMFDERLSVIQPQIPDQPADKTVTFLDMIQALAIRDIRTTFKLPLQKIREAVEEVKKRHCIERPFAREHMTYLVSDKQHKGHGEIVIRVKGFSDEDERFVQVSGNAKGNFLIRQAVELYMESLTYGKDGFAQAYRPMMADDDSILLTPDRRFGEPVLESCGYTAQTLWEAAISEGGIEPAAKAFGVSESAVKLAYRYFDHLNNVAE